MTNRAQQNWPEGVTINLDCCEYHSTGGHVGMSCGGDNGGECSHTVIVRHENADTDTSCLWFAIQQTDAESDSRVIFCESRNGRRLSQQTFTQEEWNVLRKAITGGVI